MLYELLFLCLALSAPQDAQNDSGDDAPHDARPILAWTFDRDDEPGAWSGTKSFCDGPLPPTFPDFRPGNRAALITGAGTSLVVRERDVPDVSLRFAQGDPLTIEAWVNVHEIRDGEYRYLLGKGRHKHAGFAAENQNYALRVKGEAGEARPSFLFRSQAEKFDSQKDYHRWTASAGFAPGSGWHHIAVTYVFGRPDSIRGYVDGAAVKGTWDLGGATDRPPLTDADDLVLGTGNGGGAGNSWNGGLDQVALYRAALPESVLTARYRFVPPPPVVAAADLPAGKVLVQLCEEGVPVKNVWPAAPPAVSERFEQAAFGLFEVPHKYVDTGVRGERANPYLLRAAAKVSLPAGTHRLLLRARGATRLHVDGKRLLELNFPVGDDGGHRHVAEQEKFLNLGPDFRFAPPGTQEAWCEFTSRGGEHLVVLESLVGGLVGGKKRRPETGEVVVAWSRAGESSWQLLAASDRRVPYTDDGWTAYAAERRAWLDAENTARRAALRTAQADYWTKRRQAARDWLAATPDEPVPPLPAGFPAHNAVDHFLAARLADHATREREAAPADSAVDFYRDVQPILESRCYECHRGGKAKGGLRLDDREVTLRGGESGEPAIVPGQPDRSELLTRVLSKDAGLVMPPKGAPLDARQIATLTAWIRAGAVWPEFRPGRRTLTPLTDDLAFLRRVTLDTVGVAPSLAEIEDFVRDDRPDKRSRTIDRLLRDPRWADRWMGYWQDVLAENPNILNPTLNNTGPFRWWLYESLVDDKPLDLLVTELLRQRGSERFGGPAGFGVASQNDVPAAQKGTIVSAAFLGVEMKCARCHDAPAHASTQRDLFELAALLHGQPLSVPTTSSVPADKLSAGGRKPLISVTLRTGTSVPPRWPFEPLCSESVADGLAQFPADPRDRLAALVTAPQNERFAQVLANRLWREFFGRGLVEPVDDWEQGRPSHPALLRWLGRELVRGGYDLKHVARWLLNSHAYQRTTDGAAKSQDPLFAAPAPRRLSAEQIVDSLFAAAGKPFRLEEVSLDIDGKRDLGNSISLGQPRRAWMLTSTSNERDRPSLNLPRIQAVCDVLSAFGWRGARQSPLTCRETEPNVLQPAILANGTLSIWLTRLSDDHELTSLASHPQSLESLLDTLFLRLLTRRPTADERARIADYLRPGFESRIVAAPPRASESLDRRPEKYVTWSNHLDPAATLIRRDQELAARRGDPPTERLTADWRERFEDVLWTLVNAPEGVFSP